MALGELRLRQGRRAEARAIFDEEPALARSILGRAALDLEEGRPEAALRGAERHLRALGEPVRTDHIAALWVAVRAACATGDVERAASAAAKLETIAESLATDQMKAFAAAARGHLAQLRGELEAARAQFEQAIALFTTSRAPFEAAHARVDLAAVLRALGEGDAADHEARAALAGFTKLGAADGVERARRAGEAIVVVFHLGRDVFRDHHRERRCGRTAPERPRARGSRAGGAGPLQQRDRGSPPPERSHGEAAHREHPRQARLADARRRRGARGPARAVATSDAACPHRDGPIGPLEELLEIGPHGRSGHPLATSNLRSCFAGSPGTFRGETT